MSMLEVMVTSGEETIGRITPEQFREFMNSRAGFLQALVGQFNEGKVRAGEPERATVVIRGTSRSD